MSVTRKSARIAAADIAAVKRAVEELKDERRTEAVRILALCECKSPSSFRKYNCY